MKTSGRLLGPRAAILSEQGSDDQLPAFVQVSCPSSGVLSEENFWTSDAVEVEGVGLFKVGSIRRKS